MAMDKDKIKEYIYEHDGWALKIEHAADIIHMNFKEFGWTWMIGNELKVPSREEIINSIYSLIEHSKAEKGEQIESGRIAVQIVDDDLWIALSFF